VLNSNIMKKINLVALVLLISFFIACKKDVIEIYSVKRSEIDLVNYNMGSSSTIYVSFGAFYDSGGPNNNYSNDEYISETFYPKNSAKKVSVTFTSFRIEDFISGNPTDMFAIYNGTSTSAPIIGYYFGTNSPGTVTATNVDGALTFMFYSNSSNTFSGWTANITTVY